MDELEMDLLFLSIIDTLEAGGVIESEEANDVRGDYCIKALIDRELLGDRMEEVI